MSKRFAQIVADRIGVSDNEKRFLYKSLIKTGEAQAASEETVEPEDFEEIPEPDSEPEEQ